MASVVTADAWPADLAGRAVVAGVFVGDKTTVCVEGPGSYGLGFRHRAHAHPGGTHAGWICFRSAKGLEDTDLVRHELAHLLAGPNHGHDDVFRTRLAELHGGTLPKDERKIPRAASRNCKAQYHGLCRGRYEGAPSVGTHWYKDGKQTHITWSKGRPAGKCRCWCHSK